MKVKVKKFKNRPTNWNDNGDMDYLMGRTIDGRKDDYIYTSTNKKT